MPRFETQQRILHLIVWRAVLVALMLIPLCLAQPCSLAAGQETAPAKQPVQAGAKVNINTASAEELETLPGVGPAMAQRILEYRKANGPFKRVEELLNVKGIGEKSFQRMRDKVTVGS